jgi:DNA modification methylase
MHVWSFSQGDILQGNAFTDYRLKRIYPLIICDPPYGDIVDEDWDVAKYIEWMELCVQNAGPDTTIIMWGGVGKVDDRPFIKFAAEAEKQFPQWQYTWATWVKKRAYGRQSDYLFTREEALIFRHREGKAIFNIPYLDIKRGYPGFDPNHPAKSEYLRRGLVWTDITEMMSGKIHPTQKPDKLYRMLIRTHSEVGDSIFDPCAGSLTTARAAMQIDRKFFCIEQERAYIDVALKQMECAVCNNLNCTYHGKA